MAHGYCLKGPREALFRTTFAATKDECWGKAYDYLCHRGYNWANSCWKDWNGSIKAAEKRGYKMVKVKLVEVRAKR